MRSATAGEYLDRIKSEYCSSENVHDRRVRIYAAMIAEEMRRCESVAFQFLTGILDNGERALTEVAERYGHSFARLVRRVCRHSTGGYLDISALSLAWNKSPLYARQTLDEQQLAMAIKWDSKKPVISSPPKSNWFDSESGSLPVDEEPSLSSQASVSVGFSDVAFCEGKEATMAIAARGWWRRRFRWRLRRGLPRGSPWGPKRVYA